MGIGSGVSGMKKGDGYKLLPHFELSLMKLSGIKVYDQTFDATILFNFISCYDNAQAWRRDKQVSKGCLS